MNPTKSLFTILVLSVLFLQGCTIQKRVHLPGWHISTKKTDRTKSKELAQGIQYLDQDTMANVNPMTTGNRTVKSTPSAVNATHFIDSLAPAIKKSTVIEASREKQATTKSVLSSESTAYATKSKVRDELSSEKVKEPWLPKMFGGIVGTSVALALLVPLFLYVAVGAGGGMNDTPEFDEEDDDSIFVRVFKRTFNAVIAIGLMILLGLLLIFTLIILGLLVYSEFGLLGLILGVILIVLMVLLLSFLFGKMLDFILPGD